MAAKLAMIFFGMILVNNYVLVQFLGICPFLGVSKKLDSAVGMSVAVIFVMALATSVTWPIYTFLLVPNGLAYLQTIVFILVIAVLVQLVEIAMKKYMPPLYKAFGAKGAEQYLYDDKALEKYRKTHKGPFTLQRYKGLGEMDAEQLWETTLNPETRMMKLVEIEDARMASEVTELLMGTEVPPRKTFIYDHAVDADLDI